MPVEIYEACSGVATSKERIKKRTRAEQTWAMETAKLADIDEREEGGWEERGRERL